MGWSATLMKFPERWLELYALDQNNIVFEKYLNRTDETDGKQLLRTVLAENLWGKERLKTLRAVTEGKGLNYKTVTRVELDHDEAIKAWKAYDKKKKKDNPKDTDLIYVLMKLNDDGNTYNGKVRKALAKVRRERKKASERPSQARIGRRFSRRRKMEISVM